MNRLTPALLLAALLGSAPLGRICAGPQTYTDTSKDKQIIQEKHIEECKWYVSVGGGADFDFDSTDFVRDRSLSTFFEEVTLDFHSHSFNDVFDTPWHLEAEVGYALDSHWEIFGKFKYSQAEGGSTDGGAFTFFAEPIPFRDQWDDYTSYGGQIGIRYFFFSRESRFRPFLSLSGGASHVDSIGLKMVATTDTSLFDAGDVIYDGSFYGGSTVATGTALAGLEVNVARCFAIGVDGGVTYESKLTEHDGDLDKFDFDGFTFSDSHKLNDNAGDRLYFPVNFYAKLRF